MDLVLSPRIVVLSGPSTGQVLPVDETGVRLSEECVVRLHQGRAVAHFGIGGDSRPKVLLDHNSRVSTAGCDFRLDHFEFDPAHVTAIFPAIEPREPLHSDDHEKSERLKFHFIEVLCGRVKRKLQVALILNTRSHGMMGYGTYYPGLFIVEQDIVDAVQEGFLPGMLYPPERVFCAKLSRENRCLGVLYVRSPDDAAPFSKEEQLEITRIAGYLPIFFKGFEGETDTVSGDAEILTDVMHQRRQNLIHLMADRLPVEAFGLFLYKKTDGKDEFSYFPVPADLTFDRDMLWETFDGKSGSVTNPEGTKSSIAIPAKGRFGHGPYNRLGVLYVETTLMDVRHPDFVFRFNELAAFASEYLIPPAYTRDSEKNSRLIALSGPDAGKVYHLKDGPIDIGALGFDDPEPTLRAEMTDRGPTVRTIPDALHRRASHIVALMFDKIPETIRAGVLTCTGQEKNGSWGFDLAGRPASLKPADIDPEVFRKAFFDKAGWMTARNGTISAVCIKNPKKLGIGPKSRLGFLYIETANDTPPDPDRVKKLRDIATFASKYLSIA